MIQKVIVTSGSVHGKFQCEFAVENEILCLTRMDGDGDLVGNALILEFEQEHINNIHNLRKKLINEVRQSHKADKCNCHCCLYDIGIEFVPYS